MSEVFDFTIVGSGAGGSTAFYLLSKLGLKTLLLEAGPDLRHEYGQKDQSWVLDHGYKNSGANVYFGNPPVPYGEGELLGGTTELNGGLLWNTPKHILREWRKKGYLDWVSDFELEKSWGEISRLLSVGHDSDIAGFDNDSKRFLKGFQEIGLSVTRAQRATVSCRRSNRCAFGCPTGAKQSMGSTLIPLAERHGGITHSGTKVVGFTQKNDRVVINTRTKEGNTTFESRRVILAGGVNSTPNLVRLALKRLVLYTTKRFHLNVKLWALT
jgi:choline dehydrogenase-like flavoprotein